MNNPEISSASSQDELSTCRLCYYNARQRQRPLTHFRSTAASYRSYRFGNIDKCEIFLSTRFVLFVYPCHTIGSRLLKYCYGRVKSHCINLQQIGSRFSFAVFSVGVGDGKGDSILGYNEIRRNEIS